MARAIVLPDSEHNHLIFNTDAPVVIITGTGAVTSELIEAIDVDTKQYADAVICPEDTFFVCILDKHDRWHLYEECSRTLYQLAGTYPTVLYGSRITQAAMALGNYLNLEN